MVLGNVIFGKRDLTEQWLLSDQLESMDSFWLPFSSDIYSASTFVSHSTTEITSIYYIRSKSSNEYKINKSHNSYGNKPYSSQKPN